MDLTSGFWQVGMGDADAAKTAFITADGQKNNNNNKKNNMAALKTRSSADIDNFSTFKENFFISSLNFFLQNPRYKTTNQFPTDFSCLLQFSSY